MDFELLKAIVESRSKVRHMVIDESKVPAQWNELMTVCSKLTHDVYDHDLDAMYGHLCKTNDEYISNGDTLPNATNHFVITFNNKTFVINLGDASIHSMIDLIKEQQSLL